MKNKISLVASFFNEEKILYKFYKRVKKELKKYPHEIIFINDGSKDSTQKILDKIKRKDEKIKVITLEKNYGQFFALKIGIAHATGNVIITLDGDMQISPSIIPKLVKKLKECDVVVCNRIGKKEAYPLISWKISSIYNKLLIKIFKLHLNDLGGGNKAFRKKCKKIIFLSNTVFYLPVLAKMFGYKVGEAKVKIKPRKFFRKSKLVKKDNVREFIAFISFVLKFCIKKLMRKV